jgi:amidase
MPSSHDELFRLTATEAVALLKRGDITPLDLIDAAERRIAEVEPAINALPTLCLDRAREAPDASCAERVAK